MPLTKREKALIQIVADVIPKEAVEDLKKAIDAALASDGKKEAA